MAARYSHDSYQIGIICALPLERTAVECMLDEEHGALSAATGDNNTYTFGKVGGHNVVVASLGAGGYGTVSASGVANDMRRSFRKVKYGLMVGIAGGIPRPEDPDGDIRLGDIVVGCANGVPSVINYRLGKQTVTGFEIRSELAKPPEAIRTAVSALQSQHHRHGPTYLTHLAEMLQNNPRLNNPKIPADYYNMPESPDCLFQASFIHISGPSNCQPCQQQQEKMVRRGERHLREPHTDVHDAKFVRLTDKGGADYPNVHLGTVASADTLMKDAAERDRVYGYIKDQRKANALCFEMESAGIVDNWPCLVIRGICDYSDSHKQKEWQNFAAATAAAYAKDLLLKIAPEMVEKAQSAEDVVSQDRNEHWVVPRPARPSYFGYAEVMQHLEGRLLARADTRSMSDGVVFVLSGMGGVGKSETALQFAKKHRQSFWAVFWVDCSSEAFARADFRRIAEACRWSIADATSLVQTVNQRLANLKQPSLLVLDDCDELDRDYATYLPSGGCSDVIVTTRLIECTSFATSDDHGTKDMEKLEALDAESAIELLFKNCPIKALDRNNQREAALTVVDMLGYHPLAIITGARFVGTGRCSIEGYPAVFDNKKRQLMQYATKQAKSEYENVYATFEVSAEALQESSDPDAKYALQLLDVVAFMDRQHISEDIFLRAWKHEEIVVAHQEWKKDDIDELSPWHVEKCRQFLKGTPTVDRIWTFQEARAMLCQLSLGSLDLVDMSFVIHPLVHDWARIPISGSLVHEKWLITASMLALSTKGARSSKEYSYSLGRHLETCSTAVLHAEGFHGHKGDLEQLRILYAFAWQLWCSSSTQQVQVAQKLSDATRRLLGRSTSDMRYLQVRYTLGTCLNHVGRHEDATGVLREIVDGMEKVLRPEEMPLLASQQALGLALAMGNRPEEAITLLEKILEVGTAQEQSHVFRLNSQVLQSTLGVVYHASGRYMDAVRLLERTFEERKGLPEGDSDRLASQFELATAYFTIDRVKDAIALLERTVEMQKTLPDRDDRRLSSQRQLGLAYRADNRPEDAVRLLQHVVDVQRVMPATHPKRLDTQRLLGDCCLDIGWMADAIHLHERSVQVCEALPATNGERVRCQLALASAYFRSDRENEAIALLIDVFRAQTVLPEEDPFRVYAEETLAHFAEVMQLRDSGNVAERGDDAGHDVKQRRAE